MKKRKGITMVEMLVVIAALAMVLPAIGRLFVDAWRGTVAAVHQAEGRETAGLVLRLWQKEIGQTLPAEWQIQEGAFVSAGRRVWQRNGRLVFGHGASAREIRLPAGARCVFSIERNSGLADCAVLTVSVPWRAGRQHRMDAVRMVACGRKK